jgi:hypothetical protein
MVEMAGSANVVTGFEFPHAKISRGTRDTLTAETSLPVTIFASPRNSCHSLLAAINKKRVPIQLHIRPLYRQAPRLFPAILGAVAVLFQQLQ